MSVERQDVTYCYNQRPIYEIGNTDKYTWDNPSEVSGNTRDLNYNTYHPFIFDIETSAELGQRPILLVGYNTLSDHLVVLYEYGYNEYTISKDKIRNLCGDFSPSRITLHSLSQANFERFILRPIHEWNRVESKKRGSDKISLVAHNASFDIPMMGTPNDSFLQSPKIGDQYEQAVRYKKVHMVGHRAGQFGNIYTFLDQNNSYQSLDIPVGDTLVAAKSLWVPAGLKAACESLNLDIEVSEADSHGILNNKYVEYCINDVIATYKLYNRLQTRINNMFGNLPLEHIYSTASIGKYVLRKMNYRRVGYDEKAVDVISSAYFGGRTDAEKTGKIVSDCRYTDILSEYPTVSKLTNVWDYMKADYITIDQINPKDLPEVSDLTNPKEWSNIANYYVKIQPDNATLPVRTPHLEDTTKVITSKVKSNHDLTYHYMDLISSQLIDNSKNYKIVAAWEIKKHGYQELDSCTVANIDIKPEDNVMSKCIEARKIIQRDSGGKNERTLALKITANSLYGIGAERIVKENINEEKHDYASDNGFYNPHVATTITAAGRLMLALGESKAKEYGGELIYCDTDSLILPDNCVDRVIEDFNKLNPYEGYAGTLDVLEIEKDELVNLYAVGSKKYVLFNNNGEVLEAKEHGLGNYDNLRPTDSEDKIIERLWATVMYWDLGNNPLNVPVLYDGKLNENVLWSFTASTVSMRTLLDKFTDDNIRYGDWLQSTLSYDNDVRYIALNLEEKQEHESICRVECEGEKVISAEIVNKKVMLQDNTLKTVRDVIMKFVAEAEVPAIRPKVLVNELKPVTKEATNREDIFIAKLQESFRKNMDIAANVLFNNKGVV